MKHSVTAYKYFTGKAKPYTLETLAQMGLMAHPEVLIDEHGGSGALDENRVYTVKVEYELYQNEEKIRIKGPYFGQNVLDETTKQSLKGALNEMRADWILAKNKYPDQPRTLVEPQDDLDF